MYQKLPLAKETRKEMPERKRIRGRMKKERPDLPDALIDAIPDSALAE